MTLAEARWLSDAEQRAWRDFMRMSSRLAEVLERELSADSDLSGADYAVLVPLSEAPEQRMRPRDLGLAIEWERSRLSHQLKRMEHRNLIGRETCDTDSRGHLLCLTDKGRDAIEQAAPAHVAAVRKYLFDALTPSEVSALQSIAAKSLNRLETDPKER